MVWLNISRDMGTNLMYYRRILRIKNFWTSLRDQYGKEIATRKACFS